MNFPDKPFLLPKPAKEQFLEFSMLAAHVGTWQFDVKSREYTVDSNFQALFNYHNNNNLKIAYLSDNPVTPVNKVSPVYFHIRIF